MHTKAERRLKDHKMKKKILTPILTLAQCDGVVRQAEIASELSIKVIFPKSGWQVWLNTLVYDDSLQSSVQKHKI